MTSPAEMFLKHAANVVAERRTQYGDASAAMTALAARWSATLGHAVTPAQVILCLIDLKLARLAHDPVPRGLGRRCLRLCRTAPRGDVMRWLPRGYGGTRRSPEDVKRDGWREQGLLAVSIEDQRLTWPERELIKQLGEKLYGTSRTAREI